MWLLRSNTITKIEFRKVFNDANVSDWKELPDLYETSFISLNNYLIAVYNEDPRLLRRGWIENGSGILEDKFDYQYRNIDPPPDYIKFEGGAQWWRNQAGKLHRTDGPAYIGIYTDPQWCIDGIDITKYVIEFEKKINKKYLKWNKEEWTWFRLTYS